MKKILIGILVLLSNSVEASVTQEAAHLTAIDYYNAATRFDTSLSSAERIKLYTKAIQLMPNFEEAYANRGNLYIELHKFDEAERDFKRALKLDPKDTIALNNYGNLLNDKQDFVEAIKVFKKAILKDPTFKNPYQGMGHAYEKLKDLPSAVASFTKIIELDKDNLQAIKSRALMYLKLENTENAMKDIKVGLKLYPQDKELLQYKTWAEQIKKP